MLGPEDGMEIVQIVPDEIPETGSPEMERELNDIAKQTATMFPGVTVTAVGNIPQYTTMMQYLVRGQMLSFIISVLIIAVILMIAFQSVRVGRNHSGFSNCLTT